MRIDHRSMRSPQLRKQGGAQVRRRPCKGAPVDSERGLVMMAVLGMIAVLTLFGSLAMFTAGREVALSGIRSQGAQSLYVSEGGAVAGRAALMAYLGIYPVGSTTVDPSLTGVTASGWYSGGVNSTQNPFCLL